MLTVLTGIQSCYKKGHFDCHEVHALHFQCVQPVPTIPLPKASTEMTNCDAKYCNAFITVGYDKNNTETVM